MSRFNDCWSSVASWLACYRSLRPRALCALVLLPFAPLAPAAVQVTSVAPDVDVFVQNNGTNASLTGTSLKASGTTTTSNQKKIYLKFTVTGAATGWGRPKSGYPATLKLYKSSTAAAGGTKITLRTANNDWPGSLSWGSAMDDTGIIVEKDAAVNAGVMSFDVTSYISGPGIYTFCITSTTSGDVVFDSVETNSGTTNDPVLEISREDTTSSFNTQRDYYTRQVVDVMAAGTSYRQRYQDSNAASAADDINLVGYFDVTKQPYGMKAAGVAGANATENRYALQRAINEARDSRVAVYLPPGTYDLDDQVQMIQGVVPPKASAPYPDETFNERWDLNDFPCVLIGNPVGSRSQLRISSGSTAFGSAKSLLYAWSRSNSNNTNPHVNKAASHFNAVIADIDINLNGKAGAIGIDMGGAQGTSIRDLTITATNALAGLRGVPGPGGLTESVTVNGGQYGFYCTDATPSLIPDFGYAPTLTACTFSGQTENAVYYDGAQALVMVGCLIDFNADDTGNRAPFLLGGTTAVRGSLALVDSVVDRQVTGPLVKGTRSIYFRDVYAYNGDPIAEVEAAAGSAPTPIPGRSSGWLHIQEYYDGVKISQYPGATAAYMPTRIDGSTMTPPNNASKRNIAVGEIPADYMSRHRAPDLPKWDDTANVVNVMTLGAGAPAGDGSVDDRAKLQDAIDLAAAAGKAVFIPRGDYLIGDTLFLPNGARVFGFDKSFTRLRPVRGMFASNTSYEPLVVAGEGDATDKYAATMLADLALMKRMDEPYLYLLEWNVGRDSVVRNVIFERRNCGSSWAMGHAMVRIAGATAGGRWFTFWNDSDTSQQAGPYHHLEINGTHEPLRFYMLNAETDTNTAAVSIGYSSDIEIYQTKWEAHARNSAPFLDVTATTDLRIYGFAGNGYMANDGGELLAADDSALRFTDCDRFLLGLQVFQSSADSDAPEQGPGAHDWFWVNDDGNTTPRKEEFVLYRVGQPQNAGAPVSSSAQDGWVLSGSTNSALATGAALLVGDSTGNERYKSVVSFDTSAIPGNATVLSAKLRIKLGAIAGSLSGFGNFRADIVTGNFGAGAALGTDDYSGGATATAVIDTTRPATAGTWYEYALNPSGVAAVNKDGLTQLRLFLATVTDSDGAPDTLGFHSGDAAKPTDRPVLEITYSLP